MPGPAQSPWFRPAATRPVTPVYADPPHEPVAAVLAISFPLVRSSFPLPSPPNVSAPATVSVLFPFAVSVAVAPAPTFRFVTFGVVDAKLVALLAVTFQPF